MARVKITLRGAENKGDSKTAKVKETLVTDIPPDSEKWEAICNRCGKCCFDKLVDEDDNLISISPCIYLDDETGLCTVYENRFEVEAECLKLTPENILEFDWLPDDCAYIKFFRLREKKEAES
jgi:uncharacterized cysteine cluster protein YcgN (CxxCxxCC family)